MIPVAHTDPLPGGEIDALLFGARWKIDGGIPLSYGFAGTESRWDTLAYGASGEPPDGFIPLDLHEREAVRDALRSWSSVADILIKEVPDDGTGHGALRFGYTGHGMDGHQIAYAYAPNNESDSGGDVWLNAKLRTTTLASYEAGTTGGYVLLHEIGHALGLKHPNEGSDLNGATLGSRNDTVFETVMSYNAWPGIPLTLDGNIDRLPTTPMALDIDALQYLYGENAVSRGGDDLYDYDGEGRYLETIFDTGGNDTLRATGARSVEIDLRPDHWSKLGVPVRIGDGSIQSADTVRIHRSTQIENAVGGEGDDTLLGNDADNRLEGGAGDDTLDGGEGADTAVFSGDFADYTLTCDGTGLFSVVDGTAGRDGSDSLTRIEAIRFADRTISLPQGLPEAWPTPDLDDAVAILRMVVGLGSDGEEGSSYRDVAADYDGDGAITLIDAIGVLRQGAGLEARGPAWVFVEDADIGLLGVLRGDADGSSPMVPDASQWGTYI